MHARQPAMACALSPMRHIVPAGMRGRRLTMSHVTTDLGLVKAISSRDEGVSNAHTIHSIYGEGYAYPHWSLEWLAHATDAQLDRSILMHHEKDDRDECIALAIEREPVNIAMSRLYSQARLKEAFGYNFVDVWCTYRDAPKYKKNRLDSNNNTN